MHSSTQTTSPQQLRRLERHFQQLDPLASPEELARSVALLESVLTGAESAELSESEAFLRELRLDPGSLLISEGIANDLSQQVNQLRRAMGLDVSQEVLLELIAGREVSWAIYWNLERLLRSTKSRSILLNRSALSSDFTVARVQALSESTGIYMRIVLEAH